MELKGIRFGFTKLKFTEVTGTVLDSSKWSETHVSGGGGGGYISEGTGRMQGIDISSSTSTQHDIWIKEDSTGRERPLQLSGVDVPLRQGQRITVVFVASAKGSTAAILANHSAGSFWKLCGGKSIHREFIRSAGVELFMRLVVAAVILGFLFIPFLLSGGRGGGADAAGAINLLLLFALLLALYVGWRIVKGDRRTRIDAHLDKIGRSVLGAFQAEGDRP